MSFDNSEQFRSKQAEGTRQASTRGPIHTGIILAKRYSLVKKLGRGGMGEVWLAVDSAATTEEGGNADAEVALKFLPIELSDEPESLRRFRTSFARLRNVHGTYLCPLHDIQLDDRVGHFIVMKYVRGENLANRVEREGPLPLETTAQIISWAAAGLDDLHRQRVVHRDIKPENIMLVRTSPRDTIPLQVVDYSVSGEIRESITSLSGNMRFEGGSFTYLAPERLRGKLAKEAADQYSLACVAYFLLTGQPPFVSDDPRILRDCHLEAAPDPIADLHPQVNRVLLRALEKDPAKRFASCGEFANALTAAVTAPPEPGNPPPVGGAPQAPRVFVPRKNRSLPQTSDTQTTRGGDTNRIVVPRRPGRTSSMTDSVAPSGSTPPSSGTAPPQTTVVGAATKQSSLGRSVDLQRWFIGNSIAAGAILLLLLFLCSGMSFLSVAALLVAGIVYGVSLSIYLATAWSSLPQTGATLPVDRAVALLWVPGFNLYWLFRWQYLLVSRLNAELASLSTPQPPIPLALIWLQLIPGANFVILGMLQLRMNAAFRMLCQVASNPA